jgi:hypothetical protein
MVTQELTRLLAGTSVCEGVGQPAMIENVVGSPQVAVTLLKVSDVGVVPPVTRQAGGMGTVNPAVAKLHAPPVSFVSVTCI